MARIVLETHFPFNTYEGDFKHTIDEENNYIRIEFETAKSKAGWYPFRVVSSHYPEKECMNLDSAIQIRESFLKVQSAYFNNGYEHGESIEG